MFFFSCFLRGRWLPAARRRDEGGDGEEAVVGQGGALGDDGLDDRAVAPSELIPAARGDDGVEQRERGFAIGARDVICVEVGTGAGAE